MQMAMARPWRGHRSLTCVWRMAGRPFATNDTWKQHNYRRLAAAEVSAAAVRRGQSSLAGAQWPSACSLPHWRRANPPGRQFITERNFRFVNAAVRVRLLSLGCKMDGRERRPLFRQANRSDQIKPAIVRGGGRPRARLDSFVGGRIELAPAPSAGLTRLRPPPATGKAKPTHASLRPPASVRAAAARSAGKRRGPARACAARWIDFNISAGPCRMASIQRVENWSRPLTCERMAGSSGARASKRPTHHDDDHHRRRRRRLDSARVQVANPIRPIDRERARPSSATEH
jgi:hypothetical protein